MSKRRSGRQVIVGSLFVDVRSELARTRVKLVLEPSMRRDADVLYGADNQTFGGAGQRGDRASDERTSASGRPEVEVESVLPEGRPRRGRGDHGIRRRRRRRHQAAGVPRHEVRAVAPSRWRLRATRAHPRASTSAPSVASCARGVAATAQPAAADGAWSPTSGSVVSLRRLVRALHALPSSGSGKRRR